MFTYSERLTSCSLQQWFLALSHFIFGVLFRPSIPTEMLLKYTKELTTFMIITFIQNGYLKKLLTYAQGEAFNVCVISICIYLIRLRKLFTSSTAHKDEKYRVQLNISFPKKI